MERSELRGAANYIRLAVYVELGLYSVAWISFYLAFTINEVYEELFALALVGAHYLALFGALEVLNFYEEKWIIHRQSPTTWEIVRWVAQVGITLVCDLILLTIALTLSKKRLLEHHLDGLATANIVFSVCLFASTCILLIVMFVFWFKTMKRGGTNTLERSDNVEEEGKEDLLSDLKTKPVKHYVYS